jgi:transposase
LDLTDAQWERVAPLIPNPPRRKDGRGRPRRGRREVLAGVLWILRTGAQWAEFPGRYPPYQTCHRYFQQWCRDGTLKGLVHGTYFRKFLPRLRRLDRRRRRARLVC